MSAADPKPEKELVMAGDGSIPAEQLARLGLRPGAHLRVIEATVEEGDSIELDGFAAELPELTWEDFERRSELARREPF